MIKVLHITAHMGGGVGRVLSRIAMFRKETFSDIEDIIVCLETPHKGKVITELVSAGIAVHVAPLTEELDQLIEDADIVQLEWWHHPLLAQWLSTREYLFTRLVVWSHTSGLNYPVIPAPFIALPQAFLFTTPVSLSHYDISTSNSVDVVHSSGGFEDMPVCERNFSKRPLVYGYTGTVNPAKLHPHITEFIAAVDIPGFAVEFYGDSHVNPVLVDQQTSEPKVLDRIHLRGFTDNIYEALCEMDVFVYILNPTHYGTTENGLLEAMACGVVPVVLNNPVESSIVKEGETGFIVDSPEAFASAIKHLHGTPQLRKEMSEAASADVRSRFSIDITEQQLGEHYRRLMEKPKCRSDFRNIFGSTPWEWFCSCLGEYRNLFSLDSVDTLRQNRLKVPVLYDRTKSSVFQFIHYFPHDPQLEQWSKILEEDLASVPVTR